MFTKVTRLRDSRPVMVNLDHVVMIDTDSTGKLAVLVFSTDGTEILMVEESFDEISLRAMRPQAVAVSRSQY